MIDGKMSLMRQLKEQMADVLTVEQMEKLMSTGMSILDHFRVDELRNDQDAPDDLLGDGIGEVGVANMRPKDKHIGIGED